MPRLSYRWVIVIAALVATIMAYGVHYSFGVFFKPLQGEFGWSRTATSGVFAIYQMSHCGFGFLAGWATDKYGPRIVVGFGGLFIGIGLILTSQVTALWQIYVCYGVLVALGVSVAYSPLMTTVSRWFTQRRGLALGIVSAGVGLGTVILAPVAGRLINSSGWSRSYFVIGIAAVIIIIVSALFLRKGPQGEQLPVGDAASQPVGFSLREAIRTRALWILMTMFTLVPFGLLVVMTHVVNYARDAGVDSLDAAVILSIIGAGSIAGRVAMGSLSDRLGRKRTLTICLICQTVLMLWLIRLSDVPELYLFAVLFGFSYGGWAPTFPALLGEFFGTAHMGTLLGFIMIGPGIGGALGSFLAGYIFDSTGSYSIAFLIGAIVTFVAMILTFFLKAPHLPQAEVKA